MASNTKTKRPATAVKSKPRRSTRLETRLTVDQKAMIERAAAYQGRSVSDFVVQTLATAAELVVQEHEIIRLNAEQSRAFVEALLNPPPPNAALRRAARKYLRTVESR
jgi:uncharacterized protein (DUF1778 family)